MVKSQDLHFQSKAPEKDKLKTTQEKKFLGKKEILPTEEQSVLQTYIFAPCRFLKHWLAYSTRSDKITAHGSTKG